jgi:plasmid maintenance system killer protein
VRIKLTATAKGSYDDAPAAVQKAFEKSVALLVANLRHPSLRAKKYDEVNDVWQARINSNWRFYFQVVGDAYVIHKIIPHPK